MTAVRFLRRQWKCFAAARTEGVCERLGMAVGERSSERRRTSLRATVMPPPVRGWRMFIASPRISKPAWVFVEAGRKELGMLRSLPSLRASSKDGCTDGGREGRTVLRRCDFTPPAATEAAGVFSGTSMRARVSWVPIW